MMVSGFSESSGLGVLAILLLLLVVVLWFILATTAALKGDVHGPANRVAQMYGYTVCLVAVIVGLTGTSSIIGAAFDRAYPLQSEFGYPASLSSFEVYKATYPRERMMYGPADSAPPDTSSDATLRRRYQALVDERVSATRYRTTKTFVTSGIMLVVAAALFLLHWRWLQRGLGRQAA